MANNYTEGSAEIDIGPKGNAMLIALHKKAMKMMARGADWRTIKPRPSRLVSDLYEWLLASETGKDMSWEELDDAPGGYVEALFHGGKKPPTVRLRGDEQFPNYYFAVLTHFVLQKIKSNAVVGWEYSMRCDAPCTGAFGGGATTVSALEIDSTDTSWLLRTQMKRMRANMAAGKVVHV